MNELKLSLPFTAKPLQNPKDEGRRFHELDAMRGLAAMVVMFGHSLNVFYLHLDARAGIGYTLLYPLLSGHESVIFFFLLSGFVLSLPFLRGKSQPYPTFLLRRILRIYGPYLGALILAVAGCALWGGRPITTGWTPSTWASITFASIGQHLLFIGNYNYYQYNIVFWSLVYEMRISIVFPLLFVLVNRLKLHYTVFLVAALTLVGVEDSGHGDLLTFEYIAIFMLGVLLAKHLDGLTRLYKSLGRAGKLLLGIAAICLYLGSHSLVRLGPLWHLGDIPISIGAAGFMVIGLNSHIARRILNSTAPVFLGRISYSLYLVHGTVLFAMASALKDKVSHPVFFLLYFPIAVLLSWVFYVAVEKPFMLWSRNVGRRVDRTIAQVAMPVTLVD
jgi:peptidoglycan/LPS O-acetylase OafA/YrhL